MLCYYQNSFAKALEHLFPEIGIKLNYIPSILPYHFPFYCPSSPFTSSRAISFQNHTGKTKKIGGKALMSLHEHKELTL